MRLIFFSVCFFIYFRCEKYYKFIIVLYYIANYVNWIPRLTVLGLQTN